MQTVEEPIETIHLYVVREAEVKPYSLLPVFYAFLCLLGLAVFTLYSAEHPLYEHGQLTVSPILLPLKTFNIIAPIIPTGVKTYPATTAHGMLTITNGSIISQELPKGFTVIARNGVEVVTDQAVFVPAGSADGYGISTVSAHLLTSGINMSTLLVDQVLGTSLYVRNLNTFTGGHPAYSVTYATTQDKQTAFITARNLLATATHDGLHYPCEEIVNNRASIVNLIVTWRCQFISFVVPSYMHITRITILGKNLLIDVTFIALPKRVWVR